MTVMQKHRVVIQLLCTKGITYNKKVKVLIIPPKGEDQYVPVLPATQARGVCDMFGCRSGALPLSGASIPKAHQ